MSIQERGNFMTEIEARDAGRYIAQFVPENRIQTAKSIPESLLRAHVATEMTRRKQRGGTTLESYLEDRFKKKGIIEELGRIGAGNLDVVAHRLERVERGAGQSAASLAHRISTHPEKPLAILSVQGEIEREAAAVLHDRAGSNVGNLRAHMRQAAVERRQETHEILCNPLERYSVDGRNETIATDLITDTREPVITADQINRILHDIFSEGQTKIYRGYLHLVDLFTGTLKGPQERMFLDTIERRPFIDVKKTPHVIH